MTLKTMTRKTDGPQTIEQARQLLALLPMLQQDVYDALREFPGGATGRQLETLPRFKDLAPSTVRKRIGELRDKGWVIDTDKKIDRATVWQALSATEYAARSGTEVQREMF